MPPNFTLKNSLTKKLKKFTLQKKSNTKECRNGEKEGLKSIGQVCHRCLPCIVRLPMLLAMCCWWGGAAPDVGQASCSKELGICTVNFPEQVVILQLMYPLAFTVIGPVFQVERSRVSGEQRKAPRRLRIGKLPEN